MEENKRYLPFVETRPITTCEHREVHVTEYRDGDTRSNSLCTIANDECIGLRACPKAKTTHDGLTLDEIIARGARAIHQQRKAFFNNCKWERLSENDREYFLSMARAFVKEFIKTKP